MRMASAYSEAAGLELRVFETEGPALEWLLAGCDVAPVSVRDAALPASSREAPLASHRHGTDEDPQDRPAMSGLFSRKGRSRFGRLNTHRRTGRRSGGLGESG